jgi:hypothetical protein
MASGQVVPIGENFKVGADEMPAPGQGSDPAENCNCILPDQWVRGSFVAGIRSEYVGPFVHVVTSTGHRLSVTPNHPILTPEGFVPAGALRKGDYVVSDCRPVHAKTPTSAVQHDQKPSLIQDVFEALVVNGTSRLGNLAAHQLHGDAGWTMGKVHIVRANGNLFLKDVIPVMQELEQPLLKQEAAGDSRGPSFGSPHLPFNGVGVAPATSPSRRTLALNKSAIGPDARPLEGFGLMTSSEFDAMLLEVRSQCGAGDTRSIRELLERYPQLVVADQIIDIRNDEFFAGHVYDLQSRNGLILAQGIYISNCRCTILPVVKK